MVTCPLCDLPLWSCEECDATVACSNYECAGSQIVHCELCTEHEQMSCHECLDSEALGPIPPFVRCPTCNYWCCRKYLSWCPGCVIHPTPSRELSQESNFDSKSIVRSHPPTPGTCQSCVNFGHTDAWKACRGLQSVVCPSQAYYLAEHRLNGACCPECSIEDKRRRCACCAVWLCDSCSVVD